MPDIIFEHHQMNNSVLPFIFHTDTVHNLTESCANWHDNTEFLFCTRGAGFVSNGGSCITMNKGDTIIINSGSLHSITSEKDVKYHCLIIDNSFFTVNGIDIGSIQFDEKLSDAHAEELFNNVAACITNSDVDLYVTRARLAVLEFIYYLTKNYSHRRDTTTPHISKSRTAVLDTISYINENLDKKLSLDEIASRVGFSKYHFSRIFKQNTGLTITRHINARRCDTASYLLRETEKTVNKIALECGYESPSYFSKEFSQVYGMLPSDYRSKYSKL